MLAVAPSAAVITADNTFFASSCCTEFRLQQDTLFLSRLEAKFRAATGAGATAPGRKSRKERQDAGQWKTMTIAGQHYSEVQGNGRIFKCSARDKFR